MLTECMQGALPVLILAIKNHFDDIVNMEIPESLLSIFNTFISEFVKSNGECPDQVEFLKHEKTQEQISLVFSDEEELFQMSIDLVSIKQFSFMKLVSGM